MGNSYSSAQKAIKVPYLEEFLLYVAEGRQEEADNLLSNLSDESAQLLLCSSSLITDHSHRTFNCTAYEYAFWAKDTYMRRMLQSYMDASTKAFLLKKIIEVSRTGLIYKQYDRSYRSAHFDFTPLREAYFQLLSQYQKFSLEEGANYVHNDPDFRDVEYAWSLVGLAQSNLPAHAAQEFCRSGSPLSPSPDFSEDRLPRTLTLYNIPFYPLKPNFYLDVEGFRLGENITLCRASSSKVFAGWISSPRIARTSIAPIQTVRQDLTAMTFLDEVRTQELSQELQILSEGLIFITLNSTFKNAASSNNVEALTIIAETNPHQLQDLIASGVYHVFRLSAAHGAVDALNWFKAKAPEQLEAMILSFDFMAFRIAAKEGNVEVLSWLAENAPDKLQIMIKTADYEAIRLAAANGHVRVLDWFILIAPRLINTIAKLDRYEVFKSAAKYGHLDVLIWLKMNAPDAWQEMLAARDDYAINYAAENCHLNVLKWFKAEAHVLLRDIFAPPFALVYFNIAIKNRDRPVLEWFKEVAIEQGKWDLFFEDKNPMENICQSFTIAALYGHIEILNWFKEVKPSKLQEMIAYDDYTAFYYAAQWGRLDVLEWLISEAPVQLEPMLMAKNSRALAAARNNKHQSVVDYLSQAHEFISFAPSNNHDPKFFRQGRPKEEKAECGTQLLQKVTEFK